MYVLLFFFTSQLNLIGFSSMHTSRFYNNIPDDRLHLFSKGGEPDGKKIVSLLDYKKHDIATATNIPSNSIRYDNKMSAELKQHLREWAIALNLVTQFFGDEEKTILWFNMPNTLLGDISPKDMIRIGRFKRLFKFIQSSLDENVR